MGLAVSRRLTLIHAGSGFGKTTLITQWALQAASPIVRLYLDERDNDPVCFVRKLTDAAGADPEDDAGPGEGALQTAALRAIAQLEDAVIVLDGYDVIEEDDLHHLVAALLSGAPSRVRFVIASRTEPPLPLGRLRTRREVATIKERDLCFTPSEAAEFLDSVGVQGLPFAWIEALTVATSGWVAGLQMAAFGLSACEDRGAFVEALASRSVLIAAEALAHQRPELREFLLVTSILQRRSAALCDALTGGSDGEAWLRELCAGGMICGRTPGERGTYRTHPVLDEHLRAALERDHPTRFVELHKRAAVYWAGIARRDEALRHALRSGDAELAADLFEALSEGALARGELVSLRRLLDTIPASVLGLRSRLASLRGEVASRFAAAQTRESASDPGTVPMTDRQRSVLELMLAGYSCREIALRLHLSPETVRVHYRRMAERLAIMGRS